jgi:hypothetical protein
MVPMVSLQRCMAILHMNLASKTAPAKPCDRWRATIQASELLEYEFKETERLDARIARQARHCAVPN